MECVNCGKDVEQVKGKRAKSYCNDACRMAYKRKANVNTEQKSNNEQSKSEQTISEQPIPNSLEDCQYCGKPLPRLQHLRRHPGSCYDCALAQPHKPQPPATDGPTLSSRPAEFTGTLTDFEREHYKPAARLGRGEFNPVSKPGDEHYKPTPEGAWLQVPVASDHPKWPRRPQA